MTSQRASIRLVIAGWLLCCLGGCGSRAEEKPPEPGILEAYAKRTEKMGQEELKRNQAYAERLKAFNGDRAAAALAGGEAEKKLPPDPARDKLTQAWELWATRKNLLNSEFDPLLRSVADSFTEIPVSTQPSAVKWQRIPLFKNGRPIEAIRFRSPLTQPADMIWMFNHEPGDIRWFILARDGDMRGFENYRTRENIQISDLQTPAYSSTVFQSLAGGEIEPAKEYILWFTSPDTTWPREISAAILLVPAGSVSKMREPSDVAKAMGKTVIETPAHETGLNLRSRLGDAVFVAFHPDGKTLAVSDHSGKVAIVDRLLLKQKNEVHVGSAIAGIQFSPDGSMLAALEQDDSISRISLWDTATLKQIQTLPDNLSRAAPGRSRYVTGLEFSEDGKRLIFASTHRKGTHDAQIDLFGWSIETKQVIARHEYDMQFPYGIQMLPGNKFALLTRKVRTDSEAQSYTIPVPALESTLNVYDATTLKLLDEIHLPAIDHFDISRNGQLMVTSHDKHLSLWNFSTRQVLHTKPIGAFAGFVTFAPDGKQFATGRYDGLIQVWDTESFKVVRSWLVHSSDLDRMEFSPDGTQLVTVGQSKTIIHNVDRDSREIENQITTNSIGMSFKRIPAGHFVMGERANDPYVQNEEQPARRVEISHDFEIGVFEVTIDQFRKFVDESHYVTACEKDIRGGSVISKTCGWERKQGVNWHNPGYDHSGEHPVVHVDWDDAQAFCELLSKKDGRRYRLPTEAEWEYACRGGSTARLSNALDNESFDSAWEIMNCGDLSYRAEHNSCQGHEAWDDRFPNAAPVGSFACNPFGLFDMHGNVLEWCQDWYGPYPEPVDAKDPPGPTAGAKRTARGGSYSTPRLFCRSSARIEAAPAECYPNLGFRVVREVK